MRHCVYSYIYMCEEGNCSIWSLLKTENTVLKNYLTIEIQDNEIVQVRGKYNSYPTKEDNMIIKEWADLVKFKIDYENLYSLD